MNCKAPSTKRRRRIVLRSLLLEGGDYASLVDYVVDSAYGLDVGLRPTRGAEPRGTGNARSSARHLLTINPIHYFVIGAGSARESVTTWQAEAKSFGFFFLSARSFAAIHPEYR